MPVSSIPYWFLGLVMAVAAAPVAARSAATPPVAATPVAATLKVDADASCYAVVSHALEQAQASKASDSILTGLNQMEGMFVGIVLGRYHDPVELKHVVARALQADQRHVGVATLRTCVARGQTQMRRLSDALKPDGAK